MKILLAFDDFDLKEYLLLHSGHDFIYAPDESTELEAFDFNKFDLIAMAGIPTLQVFLKSQADKTTPLFFMTRELMAKREKLIECGCNVVNDKIITDGFGFSTFLKEYKPIKIESL